MRIIRSVAAVAAGFGFMTATVTVGTIVAARLFSREGEEPSAVALYLNLIVCALGAVMGGWLAARIASFAPYGHAAVLAAIVAAITITTATGAPAPGYPTWYPSAIGMITVFGILLGGKLRAAAAGPGAVVA